MSASRFHRILLAGATGSIGRAVAAEFANLPVRMFDAAIAVLGPLFPPLAAKAELARIGCDCATESMLA
jgi:hypothetical protein